MSYIDDQGRRVYSYGHVSSFFTCKTCRDYTTYKNHKCQPLWYALEPEEDEKDILEHGEKTYAYDAEAAAEKYFAWNHSNFDYSEEVNVIIADLNGENITYWNVTVEAVPEFTAHKLDKRPED